MRGQRGSAAFRQPRVPEAPLSPTAQVKAAIVAAASGPRSSRTTGFLFDTISKKEAAVAPLLGIYLGLAVARLHERFPVLQVPYLLWGMMAIMLATVVASIPAGGLKETWNRSPQLRYVGVLAILAVVTVPLGVWMTGSFDYLVNRFTVTLAVYVACLLLLRDRKALRRIVALYVVITTVVAGTNVVAYYNNDVTSTMMSEDQRAEYLLTGEANAELMRQSFGSLDPNDIAAVMATTVPLALWLAIGNLRRRLLWTASALIMVIAVIPTASRGGLLGLAVGAIVLVLVGAKGWKRVFLVGTLAAGAFAFITLAGSQMDRMGDFGGGDYNYTASEGRIAIWKRGIVWTLKRPWGYGLDNFPIYFGWLNGPDRAAHNSLIQYSVELGVLGITAYLMICYTLVKSLLRIRRNALSGASQELGTLCGHVLATLAACWTTGFFLSNAYYPLTYMALGIGSAVVLSATETPMLNPLAAVGKAIGLPGRRRRQLKAFDAA